MIKGSVCIPVWNSNKIAWLAMESLCRQHPPVDGFEVIIFEEMHLTECGELFFRSYERQLQEIGCEKITYITSESQYPLSLKWREMALMCADTSEYFCICGIDDYKHPWFLQDSERFIKSADWAITNKGYFYDFFYDKVILYDNPAMIGLQMTARTELMRNLPYEEVNRGVDGWISRNIRAKKITIDNSDHWKETLCTNGLNNISIARKEYFRKLQPPFKRSNKGLKEIVPADIYERLIETSKILRDAAGNI